MTDKTVDDLADRESAFPWVATKTMQPGMTLRDWFAGQAVSSFCGAQSVPEANAKQAYAIADAMLAAREQKA